MTIDSREREEFEQWYETICSSHIPESEKEEARKRARRRLDRSFHDGNYTIQVLNNMWKEWKTFGPQSLLEEERKKFEANYIYRHVECYTELDDRRVATDIAHAELRRSMVKDEYFYQDVQKQWSQWMTQALTERGNMNQDETESATFVQPKITGYRQLNPTEAALMNEGKELAKQVGEWIAKLRKHPDVNDPPPKGDALVPLDQRWVETGATQLQQGFMAVIRAIARPTTF